MADEQKEVSVDGSRKRTVCSALAVTVVIVAAAFAVYGFYGFNGNSFDLSDRQVLLIVTDSMDGDVTEYRIDSFPEDTFVMIHRLSDGGRMGIEVGDVISFEQTVGSQRILNHHRVIETHITDDFETSYVITKGDNPDVTTTETVYLSSVNGEVIGTNHALGVGVAFMKDHVFVTLGIIFVVFAAFILMWMFREDRPKDEPPEEKSP